MRLYIYDEKHQQVLAHTELGNLTPEQLAVAEQMVEFLNEKAFTTKYKKATLATDHRMNTDVDSGESVICFEC